MMFFHNTCKLFIYVWNYVTWDFVSVTYGNMWNTWAQLQFTYYPIWQHNCRSAPFSCVVKCHVACCCLGATFLSCLQWEELSHPPTAATAYWSSQVCVFPDGQRCCHCCVRMTQRKGSCSGGRVTACPAYICAEVPALSILWHGFALCCFCV